MCSSGAHLTSQPHYVPIAFSMWNRMRRSSHWFTLPSHTPSPTLFHLLTLLLHPHFSTSSHTVEAAGGKCLPCVVDIRDDSQLENAVNQAVARFGGIDILVNNASAIHLTNTTDTPMKKYAILRRAAPQVFLPPLLYSVPLPSSSPQCTFYPLLPHVNPIHSPHI